MKRWWVLFIFLISFTFLMAPQALAYTPSVVIDGEVQTYDQPPVIENGRTLVPMRGIFESLGATVTWNASEQRITGNYDGNIVELTIGSQVAYVNGSRKILDVPPKVTRNYRTIVPLRFIGESLGAQVTWDGQNRTVRITSPADAITPPPSDEPEPEPDPAPEPDKKLSVEEIFNLNDEKVVMIKTPQASGSGVIVGDGLILTNEHISGLQNSEVVLHNGVTYTIEGIVAIDSTKDLALLKTAHPLPVNPVSIGDSGQLVSGEEVVAIGSPYSLQNTVSTGIISGFRTIDQVRHLQTTASISSGSSGGGLFNHYGELVGITTSAIDDIGNLNFAVDIAEIGNWNQYLSMSHSQIPVMDVSEDLIKLIRNVSMGMTRAEVKRTETSTLYAETTNELLYTGASQYGFPVSIMYIFENDKLVNMYVSYEQLHYYSLDELEMLYLILLDELEREFGEADYIDFDWFNDYPHYSLSAFWTKTYDRPYLGLNVQIDGFSYESHASILFSIDLD